MTSKSVLDISRSFKLVPFESLHGVSYSPSTVTMAEPLTVYEIVSVKVLRDLENLVRGCSRSLKLAPFDRSNIALSGTVFELFDVE